MPRRKRGGSNRAIGALAAGAAALLLLGSMGKGSSGEALPRGRWSSYRYALESMSRRKYGGEEISRIIKYMPLVEMYSEQYGVNPALVAAICHVESRFRPDAESSAGAQGMMQIMPSTWKYRTDKMGISGDPFDPKANIQVGTDYIDTLISSFQGEDEMFYKAIASYNAGIGRVKNAIRDNGSGWMSAIPAETRTYVKSVVDSWNDFEDAYSIAYKDGM